jgi:ABC-type Fe3+/spermidine/putrescine transport system ATPase subunit
MPRTCTKLLGVRLSGVSKKYGNRLAVENMTLDIGEGEFFTILGASGSGKTTCLRMIAGYVKPTSGSILIGGKDVTSFPSYRRNVGMVFQQYALFPHLTVAQNVAFGLKVRRVPSAERIERTNEALRLVHLEDFGSRRTDQLSGGQRQRVALARAVVIKPDVLLLDEPLSALDLKLREELRSGVKAIQQRLGITTLLVTHDQGEALSMSDRVAVMADGKILQVASPTALYQRPVSKYVASFVGRINLLAGTIAERSSDACRHVFRLAVAGTTDIEILGTQSDTFSQGEVCVAVFRPEDACLGDEYTNKIRVTIDRSEYVGDGWLLTCTEPGGSIIRVRLPPRAAVPAIQSEVLISWPSDACSLLKENDARVKTCV